MERLEVHTAEWLAKVSFDGLAPLGVSAEPDAFGAALGNDARVIGWARNALLGAPTWDAVALDAVNVRVSLPTGAVDGAFHVVLTNPADGSESETSGTASAGVLSFDVSGPFDSVAFEAIR